MSRRATSLRRALVVAVGLVLLVAGVGSISRRAIERVPEDGVAWKDVQRAEETWVVARVDPESPATDAGLRDGDRLLAIGAVPVKRAFLAADIMAAVEPDAPVRMLIERAGQRREVTLRPRGVSAARGIEIYIAFVGLMFLAAGVWAGLRRRPGPGRLPYVLLCGALATLFSFTWTHEAAPLDWLFYWSDRVVRLAVPALFLGLALSMTRIVPGYRRLAVVASVPPALLLAAQVWLVGLGGLRRFADPRAVLDRVDRTELGVFALYVAAAVGILGASYLKERRLDRRVKIRWLFWGSTLGFGPFTLGYLLPSAIGAPLPEWMGLTVVPLALAPLAYTAALLEYRLMDLQLFLRRGLTATTTAAFVAAVYFGLWTILSPIVGLFVKPVGMIPPLLAGLATGPLFPALRTAARHLVGRLYFRDRYSFRRTLMSFGQELNAELELDRLVERFCRRLSGGLDLSAVSVLLREPGGGFVLWTEEGMGPVFPGSERLEERLREVSYMTVSEVTAVLPEDETRALREAGLRYLVPMTLEGEVIAILGVGSRRPGEPLDSEDLDLLVALSGHAAATFASARLIRQVNDKVAEVERLRARMENIVNSSQIGLVVFDVEGVIRLWNPAIERIYGLPAAAALGRRFADVFPLHLVRRVQRAFDGEHSPGNVAGRLYRVKLADTSGNNRVVNLALAELPGEERGVARMVSFDDVTPQVSMEEQLVRNEKLASIGLLAAGVAHEVNTPLTGISSYAQMLLEEVSDRDPRRPLLEKIVAQTRRASSIANSLLNFSRSGDGSRASMIERVDLAELVRESVGLLRPQLRRTRVRVEPVLDDDVRPIYGDRGKLQQVLLNLLLNARDAVGDEGRVEVILSESPQGVRLQVRDDGVGISEEDRARIFDPFFTTKERGHGTGLGLALSHTIMREHGGEIVVDSEPGAGTTFTVVLPLRPPATAGAGALHEAAGDSRPDLPR